jgi:hypothetical protein
LLIRIQRVWVAHSFDDYQRKEFYRQAVLNVSLWTNVIAETDVDVDVVVVVVDVISGFRRLFFIYS